MVLSAPVPPDIIYEIVKYIHDDTFTLKSCSFVSEAFYRHTREYLFASVTLGQPKVVSSLNRTITRHHKISEYIRFLNIPYPFKSTLRELMAILPMLTNVRHLILGVNGPYTMIPDFSGFVPGITALLKLPRLERLEIFSIERFPAFLLQVPQRLKWLTLDKFRVDASNFPEIAPPLLPHLTTLHVYRIFPPPARPFLRVPNLRQLVFGYGPSSVLPFIGTGAETIEDVVWCDYSRHHAYPKINLGVLSNLRRLTLVTATDPYTPYHELAATPPWLPTKNMLHTGLIARQLEELNLIIKANQALTPIYIVSLLGPTETLAELGDTTRYPRLKSCAIYFNVPELSWSMNNASVRLDITRRLPLLAETGRLHVSVCKNLNWKELVSKYELSVLH